MRGDITAMATRNRQWRLKRHPDPGEMMNRDLVAWGEGHIEEVPRGGILVRTHCLATSPAQFGYMKPGPGLFEKIHIGDVIRARGIGQVMESRTPDFSVGDIVTGSLGWQDYTCLHPESAGQSIKTVQKEPHAISPLHVTLGTLGVDGYTAYCELINVAKPKKGDTLLVTAAAGGIGSLVGQVGRILGCCVIGIAGTDEKCAWICDDLGFDAAINYKTEDIDVRLAQLAPQGIDVFFDNVGGEIMNTALAHIALHARVIICGWISTDYKEGPIPGPSNYTHLLLKRASMIGTIVWDHIEDWPDASRHLRQWVKDGVLIPTEDITEGLENAPDALASLFTGGNRGNKIIRVAPDPEGLGIL